MSTNAAEIFARSLSRYAGTFTEDCRAETSLPTVDPFVDDCPEVGGRETLVGSSCDRCRLTETEGGVPMVKDCGMV